MFETTSVGLKQSLGKILFHWELEKKNGLKQLDSSSSFSSCIENKGFRCGGNNN